MKSIFYFVLNLSDIALPLKTNMYITKSCIKRKFLLVPVKRVRYFIVINPFSQFYWCHPDVTEMWKHRDPNETLAVRIPIMWLREWVTVTSLWSLYISFSNEMHMTQKSVIVTLDSSRYIHCDITLEWRSAAVIWES